MASERVRATETAVREIVERAIELARRYSVWWQLSSKESFALNEATVNEHEDYFTTTVQALFESFVVITYQLYERRRDTLSVHTLIEELRSVNASLSDDLAAVIDRNKALLLRFALIRSAVYAHRSKKQPPERIFAASGVSASDMLCVVRMTTEVVAALAGANGVDSKEDLIEEIERRAVCAADDAMLLMQTLRKHSI